MRYLKDLFFFTLFLIAIYVSARAYVISVESLHTNVNTFKVACNEYTRATGERHEACALENVFDLDKAVRSGGLTLDN